MAASLDTLHLDAVFMGVHGMDTQQGFSTPNLAEAATNRAFIRATRELDVDLRLVSAEPATSAARQ